MTKLLKKRLSAHSREERIELIRISSRQVGPGVFFSTLVVIASFLPVFLLSGMEGKMFHPLAWTKTFILLVDAFASITLGPVLISFFLKRKFKSGNRNPFTNWLEKGYKPLLSWCLQWRKTVLLITVMTFLAGCFVLIQLGTEFMPPLDEGSVLFMPVARPDVSNSEMKSILTLQDKLILSVPEVENVLGKAGRAETATDNAPLNMVESIILLKPKSEWRKGLTKDSLIRELNQKVQIPGVVNSWTQPIINRINMLSTGIRTDVGIKIFGQNLDTINQFADKVRHLLTGTPGVKDLYVEPVTGGKYLDIVLDRDALARYGMTVDDLNSTLEVAMGGMQVTTVIEGRRRYPVVARYGQDFRDNIEAVKNLQVMTPLGVTVPLKALSDVRINDGPAMINSENAMLRGTVLFNVRGRDLGGTIKDTKAKLTNLIQSLPKGYYMDWSGQWENELRASQTLQMVLPFVIVIILIVLYVTYHSIKEALITMITVPFALVGGVFMVSLYHVNLSVAVAVGFIALFGIAVETAMLMTIYLNEAMEDMLVHYENNKDTISATVLRQYIIEGATKRLRPKLMTVSVSLFGLVPVLWATGTGSDVMRPITLPLIGGLLTSTIYVLFVTPVFFEIVKMRELHQKGKIEIIKAK